MLKALILAGGEASKKWSAVENKALFRLKDKMMVEYVIEALRETSCIDKIFVVGPEKQLKEHLAGKVDGIIDSTGGIMENLKNGIVQLGNCGNLLVCSSDIPFITAEAVNDFVEKSRESGADVCYPVVERRTNELKFPKAERTYLKLKEGTFTGGNVFYVNPEVLDKCFPIANKMVEHRKSPLKMLRLLGMDFILELALGGLTIKRIEDKVLKLVGVKAKAIISQYAELGNDVDKPSDVLVATEYFNS